MLLLIYTTIATISKINQPFTRLAISNSNKAAWGDVFKDHLILQAINILFLTLDIILEKSTSFYMAVSTKSNKLV